MSKSNTEHQYIFDINLIKIHSAGLFCSWLRGKTHSSRLFIRDTDKLVFKEKCTAKALVVEKDVYKLLSENVVMTATTS